MFLTLATILSQWSAITGVVQRNYLIPVYLIAFALAPFWVALVFEVVASLFEQIRADVPTDAAEKRTHYYALGLTITGLGAVLAAPFVLIKSWVNERQARSTEEQRRIAAEVLFNERFNTANEGLSARRQVTRSTVAGDEEKILTEWQDDLVARNTAIEALEGLANENPDAGARIARILSVYVREMSRE